MNKKLLHKTVKRLFKIDLKDFQLDYLVDLLDPTKKHILVTQCRQSGKSMVSGFGCVLRCLQKPKSIVLIVSPTERQSKKLAKDFCLNAAQDCPLIKKEISRVAEPEIHFRNGSKIVYLPLGSDGRNCRSISADWILVDESSFVLNDTEVFAGVLYPMLATKEHGKMLLLGTPNGRGENFFWKCYNNPDFTVHCVRYPEVVKSGLIKQSFIDFQRKNIDDLIFRREYNCEFIDDATSYFSSELVHQCIEDYKLFSESSVLDGTAPWNKDASHIISLDPARFGSDRQVLLIAEKRINHPARVLFIKSWDKSSIDMTLTYMEQLIKKVPRLRRVVVDETGMGGFSDILVKKYNKGNLSSYKKPHTHRESNKALDLIWQVTFTQRRKEELYGGAKIMLSNMEIIIPRHEHLVKELCIIEFELVQSGIKIHAPSGTKDDYSDSFVCLCHGIGRIKKHAWFLVDSSSFEPVSSTQSEVEKSQFIRLPENERVEYPVYGGY